MEQKGKMKPDDNLYNDNKANVVRCHDCKWVRFRDYRYLCGYYPLFVHPTNHDDFCSHGERLRRDVESEVE